MWDVKRSILWYARYMKINKEIVIGSLVAVALIGLIIGLLVWHSRATPPAFVGLNTSTSTPTSSTASTTNVVITKKSSKPKKISDANARTKPFSLDTRDTIVSWELSVGNGFSKNVIQTKIISLSEKIGKGIYPNYDIYIQIAQEYEMLGDGYNAYKFYLLATKDKPQKALAFNNIGNLLARLGAYNSAHDAYIRATTLEPSVELYWISYLNFIALHEKTALTTATVFTSAMKATNSATDVRIARANWEESVGNISGAITDWKKVRTQVGSEQQSAIDTKIATLESKQ